jgi:hypothetical protein
MFDQSDPAISRRELMTEVLLKGMAGLLRGLLRARRDIADSAAVEAAPLYRWSRLSPEVLAARRQLDKLDPHMRREHSEWYLGLPEQDDREGWDRWLDAQIERGRRDDGQQLADEP